MLERTTRKLVTFQRPFLLPGFEEPIGPGSYTVDTTEELIEGLSFVAYRRVSTTIETPIKGFGRAARQVVSIDPRDLEAALELDVIASPAELQAGSEAMDAIGH